MISSLSGRVKNITPNYLVIDIGGFGVQVNVPPRISSSAILGNALELHTYLVVREDSLTLYGFTDISDRSFFELLLSVTGVGPKVAQSILAVNNANYVANAISKSDMKMIESIPGLGKKGAQRLVLELKDKVSIYLTTDIANDNPISGQLEAALVGLGYSSKESKLILADIASELNSKKLDLPTALKLALQSKGALNK
jgi:Holliday junction DNA helicase RuvA